MRNSMAVRAGVAAAFAALVAFPSGPAAAATLVWVPAGTRVALEFVTPVDSGAVEAGATVRFRVAADVRGGRYVVIRAGTPVTGTVTKVTKPGMFGKSSQVVIGFISVDAADGRRIRLQDVVISKELVSNSRIGAAGTAVAGALVLGPVGLLAGALIKGSYVKVPAGTVVTDTTDASVNVLAP